MITYLAMETIHQALLMMLILYVVSALSAYLCLYDLALFYCSEFCAGCAIRSKTRLKALDETAVFGVICRHDIPLNMINLKHGERFRIFLLLNHYCYNFWIRLC